MSKKEKQVPLSKEIQILEKNLEIAQLETIKNLGYTELIDHHLIHKPIKCVFCNVKPEPKPFVEYTTIVIVSHKECEPENKILAGASICMKTDNFSKRTGRVMARNRILCQLGYQYTENKDTNKWIEERIPNEK